jgi:hypothetical protein
MNEATQALATALAAPFDASEVKFKPAVVSGSRALALAYVDARVIQDRLDEVLGVAGWQDEYEVLPDGSVVCKLRIKIAEEWITKMDVGGPSEQPDEGDRRKAAFSDALKRAATKWGLGRYLYRLPAQWVDYDPHKRQFVRPPTLPPSALPARVAKDTPPQGTPAQAAPPAPAANGSSGFKARLIEFDGRLAGLGLCRPGQCYQQVQAEAVKAGLPFDPASWNESQQSVGLGLARAFEAARKKK